MPGKRSSYKQAVRALFNDCFALSSIFNTEASISKIRLEPLPFSVQSSLKGNWATGASPYEAPDSILTRLIVYAH